MLFYHEGRLCVLHRGSVLWHNATWCAAFSGSEDVEKIPRFVCLFSLLRVRASRRLYVLSRVDGRAVCQRWRDRRKSHSCAQNACMKRWKYAVPISWTSLPDVIKSNGLCLRAMSQGVYSS